MDLSADWQSDKTVAETNSIVLQNEIAADVTFVFPGTNHPQRAHKVILMSRSQVFYVMFTSELHDADKYIEITDIQPDVFHNFLRFLYSGHDDGDVITGENALQLLYAAKKYQVQALCHQCADYLRNNIDDTTVAIIIDQALLYNENHLFEKCLEYFSSRRSLEGLRNHHVSKETLEKIVDCGTLSVGETLVFKACNNWSDLECKKQDLEVSLENKRKVLGCILKKVRLCTLRQDEFALEVSGQGLLTAEEEVQVFQYLCLPRRGNTPVYMVQNSRQNPQPQATPNQNSNPPFPSEPRNAGPFAGMGGDRDRRVQEFQLVPRAQLHLGFWEGGS